MVSSLPSATPFIHDQGEEFVGAPFQYVLAINSIKDVHTTVAKPQSNAVNERLHQTVANILRTLVHTRPPQDLADVNSLLDNALATVRQAMRSAVHRTLGSSPGSLVFHRDMFLPITMSADFEQLRQR